MGAKGLGHLKTSDVGDVLERAVRRIEGHLDLGGLLGTRNDDLDLSGEGDRECSLASRQSGWSNAPTAPCESLSRRPTPKGRSRSTWTRSPF